MRIGPRSPRQHLEALALDGLLGPLAPGGNPQPLARGTTVADEKEAHVGPSQRREEDDLAHVGGFRARGLEKLAPRRDVEE